MLSALSAFRSPWRWRLCAQPTRRRRLSRVCSDKTAMPAKVEPWCRPQCRANPGRPAGVHSIRRVRSSTTHSEWGQHAKLTRKVLRTRKLTRKVTRKVYMQSHTQSHTQSHHAKSTREVNTQSPMSRKVSPHAQILWRLQNTQSFSDLRVLQALCTFAV